MLLNLACPNWLSVAREREYSRQVVVAQKGGHGRVSDLIDNECLAANISITAPPAWAITRVVTIFFPFNILHESPVMYYTVLCHRRGCQK
jgi:hypothetical protein